MSSNEISTPKFQTAIVQGHEKHNSKDALPLHIANDVAVPTLSSLYDVRIRILAVALNHCDYKMVNNFLSPGNMAGCDFCGIVVDKGPDAMSERGDRVCGGVFPYGQQGKSLKDSGAFAEFVTVDSRLLLRVPDSWNDLEGAALGAVGWATAGLAFSDSDALALTGFPSDPTVESEPVLIYGGATATGTMACQLLKLSGYVPIAVASAQSAALAMEYGASQTTSYISLDCAESVRKLAAVPIRHAFDCITSAESAATCFAALTRTGGRYACLEGLQKNWRTRRAVRVKEVMGYEGLGRSTQLGSENATESTYTRKADSTLAALCARWAAEMQMLLDAGSIKHHPIREVDGQWEGIINGLMMLQKGEIRGQKLVIRIST
ncbi:putative alcohol dehydrogenase [Jackrogersella minutella]|nr:putative alcohol dehydrogenase [Jackrogersella minutella]